MRGIILSVLVFTLLFSGCGLKEKREEEKARRAADVGQSISEEQEAERVVVAKQDLSNQVSFYRAVSGTYEGHLQIPQNRNYVVPQEYAQGVPVRVEISPTGIPTSYDQRRMEREAEVVAQINGISLNVDIVMGLPNSLVPQTICNATAVRPDFHDGTIRVSCADPSSPQGSRTYVMTLSTQSILSDLSENSVSVQAVGQSLADSLMSQALRNVQALYIDMYTSVARRSGVLTKE